MEHRMEITYRGYWITINEIEEQGRYYADVKVARTYPRNTERKWTSVTIERHIHRQVEKAHNDALEQAKSYIDRKHRGAACHRHIASLTLVPTHIGGRASPAHRRTDVP